MNSYNDNLRTAVVTSLQNLETGNKNIQSKLDASMFTLYYAQGARITAGNKLELATRVYNFRQSVYNEAVTNNNIATSLLASANQQKSYTAQAVKATSVCAANVQVAANAVLRLAGDMGSIYSMVSAADFGTDIFVQAKDAYEKLNETAYDAERASQTAMDASTAIAEVSSSTVADEARATQQSVNALLQVATANFAAITQVVADDNSILGATSAAEKKAEGVLEIINVEFFASAGAYKLNNEELNLNLRVIAGTAREHHSYSVSFNLLQSPFKSKRAAGSDKPGTRYPVARYCVLLVKDSRKLVFSVAEAEKLLLNNDQYVEVFTTVEQDFVKQQISISSMLDSDGDAMEVGKDYVVFVFAVFTDEYKKAINNFDDYLSAPSTTFQLTYQLTAPAADTIVVEGKKVQFLATRDRNITTNTQVEYRCIFLPHTTELIKGLLSESGLRTKEREVEKLEQIANEFDPKITELESQTASLTATIAGLTEQLENLVKPANSVTDETALTAYNNTKAQYTAQRTEDKHAFALKKKELAKIKEEKAAAMLKIVPTQASQPGFFFNLLLAEQVSEANYTVAKHNHADPENKTNMHVLIHENTTDSFGNLLVSGNTYLPAILAVSNAPEDDLDQYSSSLSDFEKTAKFIYNPIVKKN